MSSYFYLGVDYSKGDGGPDCVAYITPIQRILETILMVFISGNMIFRGWQNISTPKSFNIESQNGSYCRAYLAVFCLVFGIELTYKIISGTLIFVFNPCHVTTILQIFLLTTSDNRFITSIYRCQQYFVSGTTLAILFPLINTRLLPGEITTYFVQHAMLLITPLFLASFGGPYVTEDFFDFSWATFAIGLELFYHFVPLQLLGLATQVNLNCMLCPAVSDPFRGKLWRIWAVLHQSFFIVVHGKLHSLAAKLLSRIIFKRSSANRSLSTKVHGFAEENSHETTTDEDRHYIASVHNELVRRGFVAPVNNGFCLPRKDI